MKTRQGTAVRLPAGHSERAINVLIVDDHPIVRYGIRQLLESTPGMHFCGETSSCQTAWDMLKTRSPDVVLMDVDLQDGCAHRLIADVARDRLETRVLVYSAQVGECQILHALQSGAQGYLTKTTEPSNLLDAIRALYLGGSYLDPAIASKVIGQLGRVHERRAAHGRRLTHREIAVLQGLATGKRNREIAADLFITERTVKYHLTSMFNKLQVSNRTEALKYALEFGFIN